MGLIYANILLSNPADATIKPFEANALVDTGALHLCIPEHIALQLNLKELEKREVILADGKRKSCSYVGPIRVQFKNRNSFAGALVMGDVVLLGAIPMEDMDVQINPARLELIVNPDSPNMPLSSAR